jgi:hypothetical protein
MSHDGNTAVLGTPGSDVSGNTSQGVAYIFVRSGSSWIQQAKLVASDSAIIKQFGTSVSLSEDGSMALIGAPYTAGGAGAAYFFTRTGSSWFQSASITGSEAGLQTFGRSVSLSGDANTALVGASYTSSYQGAAYVFNRIAGSWVQQVKLTASDGVSNDQFGHEVSLSKNGNRCLITAIGPEAVYLFTRSADSLTQVEKLTNPEGVGGCMFGHSLSLSANGETGVIGAPYANSYVGAVYVYSIEPTHVLFDDFDYSSRTELLDGAEWLTQSGYVFEDMYDCNVPGNSRIDVVSGGEMQGSCS